jgi:hypothetical protein
MPGWCTAAALHAGAPEVEYFCGGVNTKLPSHAGLWREGNFLHFGFEPSPAELNEAGQAMLVNSIVYISRFTEDRPIGWYRSPFLPGARSALRGSAAKYLGEDGVELEWGLDMIAPPLKEALAKKNAAERKAWFAEQRPFLHAGTDGRLEVDVDAKALGIGYDDPKFLAKLAEDLASADAEAAARAQRLLGRYVGIEGPDGHTMAATVTPGWLKENAPYLFFSEVCGPRWLVDPLAKARAVPTSELRGPKRADAPKSAPAERQR